ncbi:MAG: Uncharacterized protein G01um101448_839, partial [Parcubacteria group bacterium Gr01-1014_48]
MKFHISSNNGVVAVISKDHAKLYAVVKKAGGDPIAAGCRVFTFCSKYCELRNSRTHLLREFFHTSQNRFKIEASVFHTM